MERGERELEKAVQILRYKVRYNNFQELNILTQTRLTINFESINICAKKILYFFAFNNRIRKEWMEF